MTNEAQLRYEEDKPHYEIIRAIVKEEFKPIERNINAFFLIALAVFGFMFVTQFMVWQKLSEKADTVTIERNMLSKFDYYQIEEDEHRMIKDAFYDPKKAALVIDDINANMVKALGFKLTTRGGEEKK
jgi:hypothetical protein